MDGRDGDISNEIFFPDNLLGKLREKERSDEEWERERLWLTIL